MDRAATVQGALRRFLDDSGLDTQRRKVCGHLLACRTEAMGGRVMRCTQCGDEQRWYHGCRDRHCPQCQGRASRRWAERQRQGVLPVAYHHLVFTLPHRLNGWVQLHPQLLYRLLFDSAWSTLKAFGEDPRRLGGQLGMTAVLHTWGQNLAQHVHLHCLVPGGALDPQGHWRAAKGTYLFPVRALSRRFRGAMVAALGRSARAGELHRVTRPGEIEQMLEALMGCDWVVYSKPCLSHTPAVVDYLARYTHRIAVTNARILAVDDDGVDLRYRDSHDGGRGKTLHLAGEEFVRRLMLHVLPRGFMRIRHFGLLANRCRTARVAQIRGVLANAATDEAHAIERAAEPTTGTDAEYPCPRCRLGRLRPIAEWTARPTGELSMRRR